MNSNQKNIISVWLYSGLVLIIFMVVIGGITRLTNSGLSMVEWNLISGTIPPMNEVQWQEVFLKYQQFPEYQKINKGMSLSEFKAIFFWEYLHRVLGRLIGLVFIIPFILFWRKGWLNKKLKKQLVVLFFLGALQGFLGWFMVKSGLVDVPTVSHFRLALHLISAFVLIAYNYWLIMEVGEKKSYTNLQINALSKCFLFLLTIQIIYGAFTAGLKAGYLLPVGKGVLQSLFGYYTPEVLQNLDLINNPYNIQFLHRIFAWGVFCFAIYLWQKAKGSELEKASLLLVSLVCLQIILGVITLVFSVPIFFAVVHQFVGVLLLLATTNLMFLSTENSQ
ncbi:MAG: COX15/CtaA family protein [Bacteroidota bacterium]|nr:COX15/CtaA family protein [Bacteroidota bacterium]